jgi:hypothetical protein
VSFAEDTTSRTGSGPANLATIPAAIIAASKQAGYLHVPEDRRDHATPSKPSASTAAIRTEADIHGTRRSLDLYSPSRITSSVSSVATLDTKSAGNRVIEAARQGPWS